MYAVFASFQKERDNFKTIFALKKTQIQSLALQRRPNWRWFFFFFLRKNVERWQFLNRQTCCLWKPYIVAHGTVHGMDINNSTEILRWRRLTFFENQQWVVSRYKARTERQRLKDPCFNYVSINSRQKMIMNPSNNLSFFCCGVRVYIFQVFVQVQCHGISENT